MNPASTSLLPAVYRALRDLDSTLGEDDPVTIEVKRTFLEILREFNLIEDDPPAELLGNYLR
ncbi:hypothetical protein [Occallatibacter savannae]|uniref:hypothetical protein n=1 Tax=Occallatibacter savannae TaxID=1002691 RepID=UPI0019528207|nr:hypothetical protein [Occallatibacter savannae]